jgi:MFS family permease
MMISTIGSSVEVLTIWGFSHKLWSLSIFALLYGATAGGYAVLRPRFATAIIGHVDDKDQSLLVFGVLTAVRGAGMIASGFIASSQLDQSVSITNGYSGHRWLKIVVYTGVTMGAASLGIVGIFLRPGKTEKPEIEDSDRS